MGHTVYSREIDRDLCVRNKHLLKVIAKLRTEESRFQRVAELLFWSYFHSIPCLKVRPASLP